MRRIARVSAPCSTMPSRTLPLSSPPPPLLQSQPLRPSFSPTPTRDSTACERPPAPFSASHASAHQSCYALSHRTETSCSPWPKHTTRVSGLPRAPMAACTYLPPVHHCASPTTGSASSCKPKPTSSMHSTSCSPRSSTLSALPAGSSRSEEAERIVDVVFALHALPPPTRTDDAPPTPFFNRSLLADYHHAYDLSDMLARALDDARLDVLLAVELERDVGVVVLGLMAQGSGRVHAAPWLWRAASTTKAVVHASMSVHRRPGPLELRQVHPAARQWTPASRRSARSSRLRAGVR
jgi:hypothetical protein